MWFRAIVVMLALGWVLVACGIAGDVCNSDADCLSGRCLEVECSDGSWTYACGGADCTVDVSACDPTELCLGTRAGGAFCMPDNIC